MKKINQIDERMLENVNGGADEGCIGMANIAIEEYDSVGVDYEKMCFPPVSYNLPEEEIDKIRDGVYNALTSLASYTFESLNGLFEEVLENCVVMPKLK